MRRRLTLLAALALLWGGYLLSLRPPAAPGPEAPAPTTAAQAAAHEVPPEMPPPVTEAMASAPLATEPPARWPVQPLPDQARRPSAELRTELLALRDCHAQDRCGFPQPDSRAAHFAAVQAMAVRLRALAGRPEAPAIALELLGVPDGHVQSAALALIAAAPPQGDHAAAVVAMLRDNHDAVLLREALPLLARWRRQGLSQGQDDMLYELLHTGAHQIGLALSAELLPFLTPQNLARYQQLHTSLPEGRKREQLGQQIHEFLRLQSGA